MFEGRPNITRAWVGLECPRVVLFSEFSESRAHFVVATTNVILADK
jgi:hypothetical protein